MHRLSVNRVTITIAAALLAALLYGTGAALEQRQAAAAPAAAAGRPRLLVLLARRPAWLLGLAAQAGGFAAHAVALRSGPFAVVQVLVTAELLVSVVLVSAWSRRRLSRACWAAMLTVAAGTAAFLILSAPAGGAGPPAGAGAAHRALIAVVILGLSAAGLAAAGLGTARRGTARPRTARPGPGRAILLAAAAGLADTATAVVTMTLAHHTGHGVASVLASWPAWGVVICGTANILLTQTAYQAGWPMATLPVMAAMAPVASLVISAGVLGQAGPAGAAAAGTAAAAAVTCLALGFLARFGPAAPQPGR